MILRRFLVGLPLLLLPAFAAAETNVDCTAFDGARAISQHFVQPTLDRADAGIAYAATERAADDFDPFYVSFWSRSIGGVFATFVNPGQSLAVRADDLASVSACLRYDQILLECKIDKVRRALDDELRRGSFVGILRLQNLVLFLQERLDHLSKGAADGSYADDQWDDRRLFDEEQPEERTEPLCPFHSDYTPPRMTGYGCDVTVMEDILSREGGGSLGFVQAELDALREVERQIDEFRRLVPRLGETSPGGTEETPQPPEREHLTIVGCQEEIGVCEGDDGLLCGSDEFCASKDAGRCVRTQGTPIPKRSLRGSFSYPTDHLRVLTEFVEKRVEDGYSRTFPVEWAPFDELPFGYSTELRPGDDAVPPSATATTRVNFRSYSGIQGRSEGWIFPEAADSQLEIADSLSDMRASIGELSRLASQKQGVRAFVLDLAYFLRRTCAFRPCQKSLEQVIRISLEDACFPYTNGQFLKDTMENPRWKQCAMAACIQVDDVNGEPIELPGNCEDILP